MMKRFAKPLLVCALALSTLATASRNAWAVNCGGSDVTGLSVRFSPTLTPVYSAATQLVTNFIVLATTTKACTNLAIGFTSSNGTLLGPGGNSLTFTLTGVPLTSSPADLTGAGGVNGVNVQIGSFTATFAAGQTKPAGTYSTVGMPTPVPDVVLYTVANPGHIVTEIRRAIPNLAVSISGSCSLSSGTAATASVSFTGHITNGVPAATMKQHSLNVDCTVPAKVRLSGSAMTTATPANSAFDNFINYRAVATFSGATTTLTTNGTTPVTSTSTGFSSSTGLNIPVTIDINMLAGSKPLLAGSYSNVMTVTVDPNL